MAKMAKHKINWKRVWQKYEEFVKGVGFVSKKEMNKRRIKLQQFIEVEVRSK